MLTLEMAIAKIRAFPPEQQHQVIEFIERLEGRSHQLPENTSPDPSLDKEQAFFELAGLWENKEITSESLRIQAWNRED
ncbi:hypothetical protein [Roseofilum capinflatum]|uniref:DUF2281 domain-containing protein n=1 Tax=Roseofilum capinflatum BLCC-M114 TaxID=3022440 RepID=A0ABT7B8E6_9CYAN|nr:hypothetical protein [Roseofilum capinflatum]MDJ1175454.1 DUF2281 domain-containing protein [Roseofilum capinflatum BLCC-M114]